MSNLVGVHRIRRSPVGYRVRHRARSTERLNELGGAMTEDEASVPEDCELVAHDTGDGWALCVENDEHDVIAYLKWPASFREFQTAEQLRAKGFVIV